MGQVVRSVTDLVTEKANFRSEMAFKQTVARMGVSSAPGPEQMRVVRHALSVQRSLDTSPSHISGVPSACPALPSSHVYLLASRSGFDAALYLAPQAACTRATDPNFCANRSGSTNNCLYNGYVFAQRRRHDSAGADPSGSRRTSPFICRPFHLSNFFRGSRISILDRLRSPAQIPGIAVLAAQTQGTPRRLVRGFVCPHPGRL